MKTIKRLYLAAAILTAACLGIVPGHAQKVYFNVDWQFNVPLGNDFANKFSGWGANLDGGYYFGESNFALGGFISYHTNNKYVPTQTMSVGDNSLITTDQQHSIYQLPFGVSGRYSFNDRTGVFAPYVSLKMGANYARMNAYYSSFESNDDNWGFYISPEIGTVIYPAATRNIGIHIAAYYSYGTNKGDVFLYSIKGLSNFGLRIGIHF